MKESGKKIAELIEKLSQQPQVKQASEEKIAKTEKEGKEAKRSQ